MSNSWNQPDTNTGAPPNQGPVKKGGGLLSSYRQQQSPPLEPQSPALGPDPLAGRTLQRPAPGSGAPAQFSPIPSNPRNPSSQFLPTRSQQQQPPQAPSPQSFAPASPQQQGRGFDMMRFVKQVSGKMSAMGRNRYTQPEPPMALYHPQRPQGMLPTIQDQPKGNTPWKRSLSTRVAYRMRRRRDRWQREQFGIGKIAGIAAIILATIGLMGSSLGGLYSYNYYQKESTQVSGIANMANPQTTRIYDRNNQLIAESYDQSTGSKGRLTPVSYKDIPEILQQAQVAIEDRTFWENAGVDPQGILRSAVTRSGGGSTITQQVIKNLTGNDQVDYTRKLVEATLALGMTQQYPKWKILEMYFNSVPYGAQDLGIESAVQHYFGLQPTCDKKTFKCTPAISKLSLNSKGKEDPLLGLARASLLAAIPNNPTLFDPSINEDTFKAALGRQKDVLNNMLDMGTVTVGGKPLNNDMIQQAEKLTASWKFKPYTPVKKAPHFVDWVTNQAVQMLGHGDNQLGARLFLTGGFNIRTTLDMTLQKYVESASKYFITQPSYQKFGSFAGTFARLNKDLGVNDSAVVVINAKNGEVLAMNGSVDYNKPSENKEVAGPVNVTTSTRQPGSTFKPIVYATTFQMGWNPGIILPDINSYFPNGGSSGIKNDDTYHPTDYGGKANNIAGMQATIRQSLENSFNIPAVKAITYAGLNNVVNNARMMGITGIDAEVKARENDPDIRCKGLYTCEGVSMVLGTAGITPLEMTSAYQTFANDGVHIPYTSILDVWDNYGHNLLHQDTSKIKGTRVFSSQVNYMLTSVLTDEPSRAREFPGDHDLSFYDMEGNSCGQSPPYPSCTNYQVAAKTGTTENFVDNWAIGYTPKIAVGVWSGNANSKPMNDGVVGITGAAPIWHAVMEYASGRSCAAINASMQAQISCPKDVYNQTAVGLKGPTTFEKPSGVSISCNLSPVDGLAGSGQCDWVIDGQSPTVKGVTPPKDTDNHGGGGKRRRPGGFNDMLLPTKEDVPLVP
ncbi:transglycosylase domain-containing protein [Ktedonospora formicarum]|uniref:Penicillin-binding protein 1A n=1 Tax=Ktedonospora formicarum TaxID=2778364 RepID=A0A8J3MR79_9CHLR|nr:transglycosylase domain-containing protein [Ktedonospora formicarum]GHO43526.1 penicillin-binding protein 1A [Ktedonospora formicarum]